MKQKNAHRLLIASGMSPQVVTETLYAIAQEPDQYQIPDELHVITTTTGKGVLMKLIDKGYLAALQKDYPLLKNVIFNESHIHIPQNEATGEAYSDISDEASNAAFANLVTEKIREFTSSEDSNGDSLHCSLAGGRKTMSFYIGYALSIFARPQDLLSHVLVSPAFEFGDFYFPPKVPAAFVSREGKTLSTNDVEIHLTNIPILSMRSRLTSDLKNTRLGFNDLIRRVKMLDEPLVPLKFDDEKREVCFCGEFVIKFTPQRYAFYRWFAEEAESIRLDPRDKMIDPIAVQRYLQIWARVDSKVDLDEEAYKKMGERGIDNNSFSSDRTRVNDTLKKELGIELSKRYMIQSNKYNGAMHYFLAYKQEEN